MRGLRRSAASGVSPLAASDARLLSEIRSLREQLKTVQAELCQRDEELRASIQDLHDVVDVGLTRGDDDTARRLSYQRLVRRIQQVVSKELGLEGPIAVASKGDERLLALGRAPGWHFPQREDGVYAGCYPSDSAGAIAHVEELRRKGASYMLFPQTALWWLDHYAAFRRHLETTAHLLYRDDGTCWIFALRQPSAWLPVVDLVGRLRQRHGRPPAILNWDSGAQVARLFPDCVVFDPVEPDLEALPYCEESIEIVALMAGSAARLAEARRVASVGVLTLAAGTADGGPELTAVTALKERRGVR